MSYRTYCNLKKIETDKVVIINTGSFYTSYDKDAELLHEILNYKIMLFKSYKKVGFPSMKLNTILNYLQLKNISYLIYESSQVSRPYISSINNYEKYLNKSVGIEKAKRELLIQIHNLLREESFEEIKCYARALGIKTNNSISNIIGEKDAY